SPHPASAPFPYTTPFRSAVVLLLGPESRRYRGPHCADTRPHAKPRCISVTRNDGPERKGPERQPEIERGAVAAHDEPPRGRWRRSEDTRLNSSHEWSSYA